MPSPPLRRIRVEFLVPITVLSLRTGNSIVTFSCVLKMDLYYVQRTDPGTSVFSALYGVFVSVFLRKAHHQTSLGNQTVSVKAACNAKHLIDLVAGNLHVLAGFYSPCPWTAYVKLFRSSAAPPICSIDDITISLSFTVFFPFVSDLFLFFSFLVSVLASLCLLSFRVVVRVTTTITLPIKAGDMGTTSNMTRQFSSNVSWMIQSRTYDTSALRWELVQ